MRRPSATQAIRDPEQGLYIFSASYVNSGISKRFLIRAISMSYFNIMLWNIFQRCGPLGRYVLVELLCTHFLKK